MASKRRSLSLVEPTTLSLSLSKLPLLQRMASNDNDKRKMEEEVESSMARKLLQHTDDDGGDDGSFDSSDSLEEESLEEEVSSEEMSMNQLDTIFMLCVIFTSLCVDIIYLSMCFPFSKKISFYV
jgi:hypothetical protein